MFSFCGVLAGEAMAHALPPASSPSNYSWLETGSLKARTVASQDNLLDNEEDTVADTRRDPDA